MRKEVVLTLFFLSLLGSSACGGGRESFEMYCLNCHGESAPPVYPADRIKKQWEEFFEKEFRKIHREERVEILSRILRRIKEYVETYAADSDQPEGAAF